MFTKVVLKEIENMSFMSLIDFISCKIEIHKSPSNFKIAKRIISRFPIDFEWKCDERSLMRLKDIVRDQ